MPLYKSGGTNLPQAAQGQMSAATQAMAGQQKQTTSHTEQKSDFWDDFYKAARGVSAGAQALGGLAETAGKGLDLYDRAKTRSAYENIAKAFGEGGYEAIDNNPEMNDYYHSKALGQFVTDRANSRKGYLEMTQKSEEIADKMYQNWRIQAMGVADAYKKGDMDAYTRGMSELVAASPMPYRLEADGNGNFQELFRSDQAGGWVATGRTITPEQAYQQMSGILAGESQKLSGADMKVSPANQAFNQAARRYLYATMMGNAENRVDPKKQVALYDRNGRQAGLSIIQNPIDDYASGPKILAYDINGKSLGQFDGYGQLMQRGYSPFAPRKMGRGAAGRRGAAGAGFTAAQARLLREAGLYADPKAGRVYDQDGREVDIAGLNSMFGAEEDK